jgi:DNA-binding PadR family transcriptional regulator
MELSPTARVILGMIRMGKRTGYDIKQLVDVSTRFFWAASYGQIYPELRRLEEQGLIQGRHQPSGGRSRTEYSLTPAGERALREWLESGRELTWELRDEGLLKLFFSTGPEVAQTVRAIRASHERGVERLRGVEPKAADPDSGAPLTLEFGIAFNEWAARWWADAERRLARSTDRPRTAAR